MRTIFLIYWRDSYNTMIDETNIDNLETYIWGAKIWIESSIA
jgi:hypothetical protein